MEYISAEEFLKQSKEVQKVLIDWYKPSEFDLYCFRNKKEDNFKVHRVTEVDIEDNPYFLENQLWFSKEKIIPLFTEEQLRKFIEDKTNSIIDIQHEVEEGYCFYLFRKSTDILIQKYEENLGHNLLKAYWKVACILIDEEITNEKMKQNFIDSIHEIVNKKNNC